MALLHIKEEPYDDTPPGESSIFHFVNDPNLATDDLSALPVIDDRVMQNARARMQRCDQIRKRGARKPTANDPILPGEDAINSDEERSRSARAVAYQKSMTSNMKRARRRISPPDAWKTTLDDVRPDNVQLEDVDMCRAAGAEEMTECAHAPVAVPVGKKKQHVTYDADKPLSEQRYYVENPPVMRPAVSERLAAVDADVAANRITIAHTDSTAIKCAVPETSFTLSTNLTPKVVKRGWVMVPASHADETSIESLMVNARTDDEGRIFAQSFLREVSCPPEDQNFIYNKLMKSCIYNCPLSRIGAADDYYALMTANERHVNELMMREPFPHERPCIEGLECGGRQIPNSVPVTLVEYMNMADIDNFRREKRWLSKQRHCVFCRWILATKTAFNVLAECAAYSDNMVKVRMAQEGSYETKRRALMLVDFYNIVGEGEYSPYDVIVSNLNRFIGLVAPVVIFVAKRFKQEERSGIKYFIQDYDRPKRNLESWVTLVSEVSSSTKTSSQAQDNRLWSGLACPANPGNLYEPSVVHPHKKKLDCFRIGPFYRVSRTGTNATPPRPPYVIRADSPFVCPETLRLLHPNVPHVVFARMAAAAGIDTKIPLWAHSQRPEHRATAARLGRESDTTNAITLKWVTGWAPGMPRDDDFWCAVYRMEWLDQYLTGLSEPWADALPREARLQVALLQDMNQMRLLLMDTHRIYTRAQCVARVGEDAYETQYGTTLASVMHCGLLPDLACIHANIPFWDKPTETFARMSVPFDDEIAIALIHVFTKVIFQPSKMRELNKCIHDEMSRMSTRRADLASACGGRAKPPSAVRFMMILSRLIFCSLGGYYPHAVAITSAHMRRELYRRFMFDVMSLVEFKAWVMHNKRLLTMVLRENHIYNLGIMPGIESVFRDLYEFDSIRTKTIRAIEIVRRTIDDGLDRFAHVLNTELPHIAVSRTPGAVCTLVHRSHLPYAFATLSNIGEMLWEFAHRYAGEFADADLRAVAAHMFWRCTGVTGVATILEKYPASISDDDAERAFRTIILFWLILRDRCADQSGKKTREKYMHCVATIDEGTRFLLPKLPPRKKARAPRAGAEGRFAGVQMYDNALVAAAEAAEQVVLSKFRCRVHTRDGQSGMRCKCVVKDIIARVEAFNVYALTPTDDPTPVGKGIEQYLWSMYDACLGWCYRPRQTAFAEEIVSSAASVCTAFSSIESLRKEIKHTSSTAELEHMYNEFHRTHDEFKQTRTELRECIERVVYEELPPDAGISIEWLMKKCNIPEDPVIDLDDGFTMMMNESNHRHPHNAMLRIARFYPRVFWIVRLLFKIRHRRESIRVYPLWADIARQQISALHEQYNAVRPGEPLPDTLGTIYYCPYHRRILAPIAGADCNKRGIVNTYALGVENIGIEPLTNTKYCNVRTGRIQRRCVNDPEDDDDMISALTGLPRDVRKLFTPDAVATKIHDEDFSDKDEDDDYEYNDVEGNEADDENDIVYAADDDDEDDDDGGDDDDVSMDGATVSTAAISLKRKSKKSKFGRCTREPAKSVNIVGRLFMMYKKLYMLCPYCGHVMNYGRDKCTEIGLWCGACVRGEKAMAEKLGISWDATNQCADPTLITTTIAGVPVWKRQTPVCIFCMRQATGQKFLRYHLVYNDLYMHLPPGLCYTAFCEIHAQWWIGQSADAMRLSNIFYNLTLIAAAQDNNKKSRAYRPRTIGDGDGDDRILVLGILFGDVLQDSVDIDTLMAQHRIDTRRKRKRRRSMVKKNSEATPMSRKKIPRTSK